MSNFSHAQTGSARAAVSDLLLALPAALLLTVVATMVLDRGPTYGVAVTAVYAVLSLTILLTVPAELRGPGMGPANRVTLGRSLLMLPIVGVALDPVGIGVGARWWTVVFGTAALLLDGVDGWVARRTKTSSPFGARFDMEIDAAFLMVLSVLVWRAVPVGPWVLFIGGMRYLFIGAGAVWPVLRGDLPPSMRRKVICVVQGVALLVAVGPIIPAPVGASCCALALALLAWSFGVDTLWLLRERAQLGEAAPFQDRERRGPATTLR